MKKISIAEVAKEMGVSQQFVRLGLQRGILKFGCAVKMSNRYTYYINPKQFNNYIRDSK